VDIEVFYTCVHRCLLTSWEGNRRSGVALDMHQTLVVYPPTGSKPK